MRPDRRGRDFTEAIETMLRTWRLAAESTDEGTGPEYPAIVGPPPRQTPHPPLWIGGTAAAAVARAIQFGDGYISGYSELGGGPKTLPFVTSVRRQAEQAGRTNFACAALIYGEIADSPDESFRRIREGLHRYYGRFLPDLETETLAGAREHMLDMIRQYRDAGIDLLVCIAASENLEMPSRLAELCAEAGA